MKQLIGRRFSENSMQNDIISWLFRVIAGRDDHPIILV
jgi:L1 cell adhesion molecule like protein